MSPLMKSSAAIAASLLFSVSIGKARAAEAPPKRDRLITFTLGAQLRPGFPGATVAIKPLSFGEFGAPF